MNKLLHKVKKYHKIQLRKSKRGSLYTKKKRLRKLRLKDSRLERKMKVKKVLHQHEAMRRTFHVAMVLLGPGFGQGSDKARRLGSNLFEVTALRIALS